MEAGRLGREWREENARTGYPFAARARLANAAGAAVPAGALVDLVLYPPGAAAGLYLATLTVGVNAVRLGVAAPGGGEVCWAAFAPAAPPPVLAFRDPLGRAAGAAVLDPAVAPRLADPGPGTHTFAPADTEFCAACVVPPRGGVTAVALPDGTVLDGTVVVVGGPGVKVGAAAAAVPGPGATVVPADGVRADAVGDPLFRRARCGEAAAARRFVTVVRVEGPGGWFDVPVGPDGAFDIEVGTARSSAPAVRVNAAGGTVTVSADQGE